MRNNEALHIYCLPSVRSKLEKLAAYNQRSLSAEVKFLIEQAFVEHVLKTPKTDLKG